jgi:transposase
LTERTFAHVCETEGARRTWLIGIDKVRKRYLIATAANNLGCRMRKLFQMGKQNREALHLSHHGIK